MRVQEVGGEALQFEFRGRICGEGEGCLRKIVRGAPRHSPHG